LYQQLFTGIANYETLGNRILHRIKAAHAFRQIEQVRELSRILINIPIKEYQLIAQYYLAWRGCREKRWDTKILELVAEQSHTYQTRALMSLGAVEGYNRDYTAELYYFNEALKTSPNVSDFIEISKAIAVIKAKEGFHKQALKDFENVLLVFKHANPFAYYDFLNSYAVELGESGRKYEARNISRIVLASPFIQAYPEWQQTARDLREPNRSFISVPLIKSEHAEFKEIISQLTSEPMKPAEVIPFKLKEAPPPQKLERLTPQEINELSLDQKRELILSEIRTSEMSEFEYNKLIVMLGLLKRGPADKILDLEDEEILDDIAVIWANHVEPENFAAVMSALRDCEDSSRRNDIIDRMIKKAFQQTHQTRLSEEAWRLQVERRLPKK
jgi:hypothetical protein